ncbi:MinD/ParA family ATP-binding protein [Actinomadura fibrosa]|uniref:AAA family ATPase n=1 Tax=Actinomadura fibrosa TaxID=111802 RepID=A0ABW2XBK4_9ACTN|nr:MinD/ParA family protein [Actinomadura fibrosa]
MARNEHDGRSLEERLASLDAMSGEATGPSTVPPAASEPAPSTEQAPDQPGGASADQPADQPVQPGQGAAQEPDPNANPWLAAPPPFQGPPPESFGPGGFGPEGFGPPPPVPQEQGGPSQGETPEQSPVPPPPSFAPYGEPPAPPPFEGGQPVPPYDGGPMPQPFDGGMLPPPYVGMGGYDPAQPPAPPAQPSQPSQPSSPDASGAPPQPPYQPQSSPYIPQQPWEIAPQPPQPPQPPEPSANGEAAPPLDQLPPYLADQFVVPEAGAPAPASDPNTGQPYPQDPNAGGQPYPSVDPSTGQPFQPNPNAPAQPYGYDPGTSQPFPQDPSAGAQPYAPLDPNAGQPYPVDPNAGGQPYPPVDPSTGQPYPQDPNAPAQPYGYDPGTGQPYAPQQGYAYGPQQQPGPYQQMPPGQQPAVPQQGPYQPQPQQPQQPPQDPQSAESLSSENLLGERRIAPSSGWRRAVYKATAGNIHPGESQGEIRRKDLVARARTVVAGGHHRVAVMSLKGGVGKTTTTTGLGSMLGSLRGDRVIAVDANPDRGTLSDKVKLETAATVRDLLNNRDAIHRYADVRAFTSQNAARLEVLASDRDPAVSEAFSAEDYAAVAVILEQYYSICITDCGTGLLHSAMSGVLALADQLVLVSSPSVDGARSASATLDWLEAHDHGHLVRNGVVVLSMVRNRTRSQVDLDKLQAHFESRCRAVVRIPYDDHLEEGAEVELEQLAPATREAYLSLAAAVGDGFAFQRPQSS